MAQATDNQAEDPEPEGEPQLTEQEELARLLGGELSAVAQFAASVLRRTGAYSVLCPGCGPGQCSAFFAHRGFRVTAYDSSAANIRSVSRNADLVGVKVECYIDDVVVPTRQRRRFDAIFSHNILHQMRASQRRSLLRSFHQALRPGGVIIVSVLSAEDERYGYGREIAEDTFEASSGESIHFYTAPELHEELSEFFEVSQIEEMEEIHQSFGGQQRYRVLVATGIKNR